MLSSRDRRLIPARPDVAAAHLRGAVDAARFVEGVAHQIVASVSDLREAPDASARLETQLRLGEIFIVYDTHEGWAWGQAQADGYVGYVRADDLSIALNEPTHRVSATHTLIFPAADIKSSPHTLLPFGAQVRVLETQGKLARLASGGWVFTGHLTPIDAREADWVSVAERFVGAPYLWGGKTHAGVDCSGLVQLALESAGVACPRDSDMQEDALGVALDPSASLQRGDLVFWPGHVGIMRDSEILLHANAFHMQTETELLREAVARISDTVTAIKRL